MKSTERYVKAATRGLWGAKKRELRTELEGHINERIQEFRLGGLSAGEAERQTLRELGTPERVSGGMLGVHTVPAVGKAGAVSFLLATALLTAVPQGLAQVESVYGNVTNVGPSSYLNFAQLVDAIKKAGGELNGPPDAATITIPGAPRPNYPLNTAQWRGATLEPDRATFLQTDALINGLLNSGADLRVSGWKNPTLQANTTQIHLEVDDWRVVSGLYSRTLISSGSALNAGNTWSNLEPTGNTSVITFRGNFKENVIYAYIMPVFSDWTSQTTGGELLDSGNIILKTNVNQAEQGRVQFRIDNDVRDFKLFSDVNAFQAALDPYRDTTKLHQWDAAHPAPVLVLELSGHFGPDAYKVVPPSSIQQP
ncbi:permease prefix domain 1-containing protein [Deinococcus sp.]|uniref:permease prefix domain 1-containing protein n=1 Tax=Deinococcus sp. TaxID=47478 RepID=UPI003B5C4027